VETLRDVPLSDHYRSDTSNVVTDFYVPALSCAVTYDRAAGYFTSASLALISRGVDRLVERRGKIRLIVSPNLTEDDIEEISKGYEIRAAINRAIAREIEGIDQLSESIIAGLAYAGRLVAQGFLEIKIALGDRDGKISLFHEKAGVIEDGSGNAVVFSGSLNETASAYIDNFESIEVFKSWLPEDSRRANRIRNDFNRLWFGETENVKIYDFPDAVKSELGEIGRKYAARISRSRSGDARGWATLPTEIQLRDYQKRAITAWFAAGCRGIFRMATGTGKTITALAALDHVGRQLRAQKTPLVTVVVVPLLDLVEQWSDELARFGVTAIKCRDSVVSWEPQARNVLAGLTADGTARSCTLVVTNKTFSGLAFQALLRSVRAPLFLIADEAHHLGAEHLRDSLPENARLRLALSATPERWFDDEGTEALISYFGEILIELGLKEAIGLGALTPYRYWPVLVPLTDVESVFYAELTTKIGAMYGSRIDSGIKNSDVRSNTALGALLNKRAKILGHAEKKVAALREQINRRIGEPFQLVYCAEGSRPTEEGPGGDSQVDQVVDLLGNELALRVHPYTAKEPRLRRRELLRAFSTGTELEVLVSMRCLDEGVDLPDARVAYMLASSSNPRQFIQRRGRILRRAPGKRRADIIDFIAVPPRDPELYRIEQGLFRREMARVVEFARYAQNYGEALSELTGLREYYDLMDV